MADWEDGLEIWRNGQAIGEGPVTPVAPAIVLHWPKYPHNVGAAVRLASCYGISQVWYSGDRLKHRMGGRIPREERMRRYSDVTLINHSDPLGKLLEALPGACPVAVELRPGSEPLVDFVHPNYQYEDDGETFGGKKVDTPPIYVFGPEDGSIPGQLLKRCHRFVVIPTHDCLNLATAVATVLYDRMSKMPASERPMVRGRGRDNGQ